MTGRRSRSTAAPDGRRWLTTEQIDALWRGCTRAVERVVVASLLDLGLRVGELARLRDSDVDWQARRVRVLGKGGQVRTVPLTPRAHALLSAWLAVYPRLPSVRGCQGLIRRVAVRAALPIRVTPHTLRHTFAVQCLRHGLSVAALQRLLGHAELATTAIYLQVSAEDAARDLEAIHAASAAQHPR